MIRGSCLCKRVRFEIHGKLGHSQFPGHSKP